jgi:hypothetical protein
MYISQMPKHRFDYRFRSAERDIEVVRGNPIYLYAIHGVLGITFRRGQRNYDYFKAAPQQFFGQRLHRNLSATDNIWMVLVCDENDFLQRDKFWATWHFASQDGAFAIPMATY